MKRIVYLGLISAFIAFIAVLPGFRPMAYAAVPYGLDGAQVSAPNSAGIWLSLQLLGGCNEGEVVPAGDTLNEIYFANTLPDFGTMYLGGQKCDARVSYQHSALASLTKTTIALYNPPVRTSEYVLDVGHTLGFIPKQVHAQGVGFAGLTSLLPIWKAFRNVAYALLAVIMVVIGFMVMFRKKIDPKTVVTVQNAIPRVVVALLLVTFSYAIVGLMIDLMYFFIVLSAGLILNASDGKLGVLINPQWNPNLLDPSTWLPQAQAISIPDMVDRLLNGGIGGLVTFFFSSGFQAFDDIGKLLTGADLTAAVSATILPGVLGYLIAGGGKTGVLVGCLLNGPVLLLLIFLIILLFGIIRLIFLLVDAYINIIISLIFSPFQLMMEAIPGTNSFNSWFRWLFSKVITFPITAVLLMLAAYLTSQSTTETLWAPPLLAKDGAGATGLAGLIGLGMLLVIPMVVGNIQKALKAEPFIPGGVGAVIEPVGSGAGQLFNMWYQWSFISSARRHKPDTRSPVQTMREGAQKGLSSLTGGGSDGH